MLFEVTTEDVSNVLFNHFNFTSNSTQEQEIIMNFLDFVPFDAIVSCVDCLDEQTELVYAELKKQIEDNFEYIDFLQPILIQKKLKNF